MVKRCERCGGSMVPRWDPDLREMVNWCILCGQDDGYRAPEALRRAEPATAPRYVAVCAVCGEPFGVFHRSHARTREYCSVGCAAKGRPVTHRRKAVVA